MVNRYRAFVVAIGMSCNLTTRPKLTAAGFGPDIFCFLGRSSLCSFYVETPHHQNFVPPEFDLAGFFVL